MVCQESVFIIRIFLFILSHGFITHQCSSLHYKYWFKSTQKKKRIMQNYQICRYWSVRRTVNHSTKISESFKNLCRQNPNSFSGTVINNFLFFRIFQFILPKANRARLINHHARFFSPAAFQYVTGLSGLSAIVSAFLSRWNRPYRRFPMAGRRQR